MDAASESKHLPDLEALDIESLKALVLAKQTEIENLNLLVLKLKRMHFGQRSEKLNADIAQLELRRKIWKRIRPQPGHCLHNWQSQQSAANPERNRRAVHFPPNCLARRKRFSRNSRPVPIAAAHSAGWVKIFPKFWNMCLRASK
jgi:hypothetical protein